jgi:hypothetical protein
MIQDEPCPAFLLFSEPVKAKPVKAISVVCLVDLLACLLAGWLACQFFCLSQVFLHAA